MIDPLHFLRLHLKLECVGLDAAGQLVRTKEGFRQQGYARQVTAAWAAALQAQGIVPFYSHKWENLASQAVAQSLGLIQYIADAGYA